MKCHWNVVALYVHDFGYYLAFYGFNLLAIREFGNWLKEKFYLGMKETVQCSPGVL